MMRHFQLVLCISVFCLVGSSLGQAAAPVPVVPETEAWQHVLRHPKPLYPAIAKSAHITGQVAIATEVDASGNVTRTAIISGPPLLRQSALDAVKSWHFTPFIHDGVAATIHTKLTLTYQYGEVSEPKSH
jgi:TonB family protein